MVDEGRLTGMSAVEPKEEMAAATIATCIT